MMNPMMIGEMVVVANRRIKNGNREVLTKRSGKKN